MRRLVHRSRFRTSRAVVAWTVLACSWAAAAQSADAPYIGEWRLNPQKSLMRAPDVSITESGGEWRIAQQTGQSATFRMDGKPYRDSDGVFEAWTQLDDHTWTEVDTRDGKTVATGRISLSRDGRVLTIHNRRPQDGKADEEETITFERADGGSGLAGEWSQGRYTPGAPVTLSIAPGVDGGIRLEAFGVIVDGKFDGQPYPVTGPAALPNLTATLVSTGAGAFTVRWGTLMTSDFKTSPDGKTVTEEFTAGSMKSRRVWDRVK